MTIQNWTLGRGHATIVCDSLATSGDSGQPSAFVSKAWCVPHRSIMLAVKDWAHPAMTLYSHLALGAGPHELPQLALFASRVLQQAAAQFPHYLDQCPDTRIVLFAWDEKRDDIAGWIFRAGSDFAADPMQIGCILTPANSHHADEGGWYGLAIAQQAADRQISPVDRDNIGGWLLAYDMILERPGCPPTITIRNLGVLPHFNEDASQLPPIRASSA